MSIRECLSAIRKLWWVVVLGFVLGTSVGAGIAYTTPAKYASTVTFFATTPSTGAGSALQGDSFGQQRVNSYVQLLSSERLADAVAKDVPGVSAQYVMSNIAGVADLNTVVFTAKITDTSVHRALAIASAVSIEFPKLVNDVESANGQKTSPIGLDVVSGPSVSSAPVSPKKKLDIGIAALVGLALALGLIALREVLNRSVRSADELRSASGLPVLGEVGPAAKSKSTIAFELNSRSSRSESFRQLRTSLKSIGTDKPSGVLVVTSSNAGEGRTSAAISLAIAFSETGRSVLLVDADLRQPMIGTYLGLENPAGLTDVLTHDAKIDDVTMRWGDTRLDVLLSGTTVSNSAELLGGQNMAELLEVLRTSYEVIVFDTAPLGPVTDGAVVAAAADGVILVAQQGKSKTALVTKSAETLRSVGAHVLGGLLTFSASSHSSVERSDELPGRPATIGASVGTGKRHAAS